MPETTAQLIITETALLGTIGIIFYSVHNNVNHTLIKLGFMAIGLLAGAGVDKLLPLIGGA